MQQGQLRTVAFFFHLTLKVGKANGFFHLSKVLHLLHLAEVTPGLVPHPGKGPAAGLVRGSLRWTGMGSVREQERCSQAGIRGKGIK